MTSRWSLRTCCARLSSPASLLALFWCGVSMKAVEFFEWRVAGAGVEESNVKTIKVKLEEIFFASFLFCFYLMKHFLLETFAARLCCSFPNSQGESEFAPCEMDIYTSQQKEFFMRSSFRSSRII